MEAFNVPYCGFNPNSAIGNVIFVSTTSFSLTTGNQTHKITHDLCLCDIFTWSNGGTYAPAYDRRYAITLLKDDGTAPTFRIDNVYFSKNGNTITVRNNSGNIGVATFYDFDFA